MKKFLVPVFLFAIFVAALGTLVSTPSKALAQNPAPGSADIFVVFSGTANTAGAPAPVKATANTSQRIRIHAISLSSTSSGAVSVYDGTSTVIMSVGLIANTPYTIGTDFFLGGVGAGSGLVLGAGDTLKIAQPAGGTLNCTFRIELD